MKQNATMKRFEIKLRGDNVYDVYVDKMHIGSKGYYAAAINLLKEYLDQEVQEARKLLG